MTQGVTNYPVTITMEETGDLLPGMNVDAEIILEQSENALVIPVAALMRGNRVYVKSDSETEQDTSNQKEVGVSILLTPKTDREVIPCPIIKLRPAVSIR